MRFVQKHISGPHAWSEQTRTPRHGSQEYAFGTNPLSGLYSHARLRTLPYKVTELGSDSGSEASDSFRRSLITTTLLPRADSGCGTHMPTTR